MRFVTILILCFFNVQACEGLVPIFFFGLSGVGKTTFIHQLAQSTELFYIPVFTVTRAPREDDDPRYFEYISLEEFHRLREEGEFYLWMEEGTLYGYRNESLSDDARHPLMYASPYCIDAIEKLKGIKVLMHADAQKGLLLRGNIAVAKVREKTNKVIYEKIFGKEGIFSKMDVFYQNNFENPKECSGQLEAEIIKIICIEN